MTRHGECKTPGGKLVAADVAVTDAGLLAGVRVHGDFFVEPAASARPTLDAVAAALTGTPADQDVPALAARVRAAVPFGVELVGTTPEAVAVAVRRAVTGHEDDAPTPAGSARIGTFTAADIARLTASWHGLPWRVLPERPLSAAVNVALDEVLSDAVGAGLSPPTVRFWRWSEPAVIIGRTQSLANEVDPVAARDMGVTVVRRMTGGGAMFLQPHGAVTYSLYLPDAHLEGLSVRASYEVCEAWVVAGLRALGVDAHHVPINDIACAEGKIGGAAQARRRGVVLHHTTIAYDMDPGDMVRVLRIGREKLRDKGTASAQKRVSPLARQTGLSRDAVAAHLQRHFHAQFGGTVDALTTDELAAADALAARKYRTPAWTEEFA